MLHPIRDHRRKELEQEPFPPAWAEIIARDVPYCRHLHADERARLENLIKVFIREKHFEGCGGLVVTDEMKVTIAAQACLLLLNLRHDYFERLVSILVYPQGFDLEQEERGLTAGTVSVTSLPVIGLSSSTGAVVLSWPDTLRGARHPEDGINVVFHEFAHQLDQESGDSDGGKLMVSHRLSPSARVSSTTPTPSKLSRATRRFDSIPSRNEIAVKLMKENGVAIDDLYAVVLPVQDKIQRPGDVHYDPEGYEVLSTAVANSIEAELPKK